MDPFNNSQQNTEEWLFVCSYLTIRRGNAECVASLEKTLSGNLPGVPLLGARANTTHTSQQNIIERGVTRSKEERGGEEEEKHLYNTSPTPNMSSTPTPMNCDVFTRDSHPDQASRNQIRKVGLSPLNLAIVIIRKVSKPKSGTRIGGMIKADVSSRCEQTRTMDRWLVTPYKNRSAKQ